VDEKEAVYASLIETIRSGEPACVLTVVQVSGSTPREVGAKMLLRADGSTVGTIGGGQLEAAALSDAREALATGQSQLTHYSLAGKEGDLGVCGGEAEVFVEVLRAKPTVLIAGAGHVGLPLADLAQRLGFRTVVFDDRPEFASEARFPGADRVVAAPFEQLLQEVEITTQTYVVIATRGHEHDQTVLRQVIATPAAYIGMIGSRRKVRTVFEHLLAEGIAEEKLGRVYAPVGLRTGGQTPAEIALGILAEILTVRYGGTGEPLSWRDNPLRTARATCEEAGVHPLD